MACGWAKMDIRLTTAEHGGLLVGLWGQIRGSHRYGCRAVNDAIHYMESAGGRSGLELSNADTIRTRKQTSCPSSPQTIVISVSFRSECRFLTVRMIRQAG